MHSAVLLILSLVGVFVVQRLLGLRKTARDVGHLSGPRYLISPSSLLGNILPPIPRIVLDRNWSLNAKHQDFAKAGRDAFALITAWPRPQAVIFLADAAAIKEVTTSRARFPKPVEQYRLLMSFGRNIVASEGEEWKRYRKVAAPAFSERNNKLVWDETVRIMADLFDNVWENKAEVVVDHCLDITLPIALFVIGVAGFGRRISWAEDLVIPPGHQISFKDALHFVSTHVFLWLAVPSWAMGATATTRKVRLAFNELNQYMMEMINTRRNAEKKEERYDLFSSLLDASQGELDGDAAMTDRELVGNIFIFLLAGHETTAHTLCFTFALLALHPEVQERLHQQIEEVMSRLGRLPTYEDMSLFPYSMAVFNETLRLFPPVVGVPKRSAEDTTLTVTNHDGGKTTFPVPTGTEVYLHVPGIHYNPRYWEDPQAFKPERFLGDWPRDAFLPFSQGARACIGRRFFETEGIAIMTMLVSRYKIELKDEPQFAGETYEQRFARLTAHQQGVTTMPVRMPLVFKKR